MGVGIITRLGGGTKDVPPVLGDAELKDSFEYNDEFLRKGGLDHDRAAADFEPIMFALYNEKAFERFFDIDAQAVKQKTSLQNWGFMVITMGFVALVIAAAEMTFVLPTLKHATTCPTCDHGWLFDTFGAHGVKVLSWVMAIVGSLLGIISFWLGFFRGGTGARKRKWLRLRAACEAFRQWRWHYYLGHLDEISRSVGRDELMTAYEERWAEAADRFFDRCEEEIDFMLDDLFDETDRFKKLDDLVYVSKEEDGIEASRLQREETHKMAFKAYDAIRFRSQIKYAHYLTRERGKFRTHPARQKAIMHGLEEFMIVSVLVLHVLIFAGVLLEQPFLKGSLIHFLSVTTALFTLAVVCLERGLNPSSKLGRLQGYLAEITALRKKFHAEEDVEKLTSIAYDLEAAACNELEDFLHDGNRTRFII